MSKRKGNTLIVIEEGELSTYLLDDKRIWTIGRTSKDIKLHVSTVSREHGYFENQNGFWFYVDKFGKNGTVYNGKHLIVAENGNIDPVMLEDGDIFIFGGCEKPVINNKTVWAGYFEQKLDDCWRIEDTKGLDNLIFVDNEILNEYKNPNKGLVVQMENGIAIYMGNLTYLYGDIHVKSA